MSEIDVSFEIETDKLSSLDEISATHGLSRDDLINEAIADYLKLHKADVAL